MRSTMDKQLEQLNQELITMGAMCEEAIENAVKSLIYDDDTYGQAAIAIDTRIDEKEREIESLALKIMVRHQPVARDLRQVSAALKIITDMERIGDQARDIAEITPYVSLDDQSQVPLLTKMAAAASKMVNDSIDAFVKKDVELARQVIKDDDFVDQSFVTVKEKLESIIHKDGRLASSGLDLLMIAKYLERIGDHATNIAEWVEFSVTGIHGGQ